MKSAAGRAGDAFSLEQWDCHNSHQR